MSDKLTPKQKRFCQEYVIDLNGKQAAIRAGYSLKSAQTTASEILTYPMVKNYIQELQQPIVEKIKISAEAVLQEIADLAFETKTRESRGSKVAALKMLGEHMKLFTQLHESTMTFTQMGRALMKTPDGKTTELKFEVGEEIKKKDPQ